MPLPAPRSGDKKREFIRRFLSSEEARKEFPDPAQRRAVAESAWKRSRVQKADYYTLAKQSFTVCCAKQDVPEVEAIIGLLQNPLEDFWTRMMQEALDIAVQQLRDLEDGLPTSMVDGLIQPEGRRRNEELLILAFIEALVGAARGPLSARLERLITRATEELLRSGGRSQGLEIDLGTEPLARAAARNDLRTLISGRIETRTAELREQAQEFLRSRRARTPARAGDITGAAEGFKATSLQDWLANNVDIAGLRTSEWLPAVADQWAYRWFVIGQYLSGVQAGLTELRAVAVIDGVTTEFCKWVNGRVIAVGRAARQLDRHIRASMERDIETLMANWPMLSSKIVQSKNRGILRRAFSRVGLPPYHFRCRTLVQWVRIGR